MYLEIMIIDSDLQSVKRLKYALQNEVSKVCYTTTVMGGIKHLMHCYCQLVIMDITDSDADDFLSLKMVRGLELAPVLVISTRSESSHIARILSISDDYMSKPIDTEVCAAKIQALLRRSVRREYAFDAPPIMTEDNHLLIDPVHRKVF